MRLVKLVENLQQLARAEAAHSYLKRERLSLPELIDQLLPLYRPIFEERRIAISTDFPADCRRDHGDRDKLLQAVRNLLENCAKYTPPGGWLRIATARTPSGIQVILRQQRPRHRRRRPALHLRTLLPGRPLPLPRRRRGRHRPGHRQGTDRGPRRPGRRGQLPGRDPHLVHPAGLTEPGITTSVIILMSGND